MRGKLALTAIIGVALIAGGCNTGGGTGEGTKTAGTIQIDGSSTVAPISQAVAEAFRADEPGVNVAVGTSGTGGGFERFCNGETDISDASRPISEEEQASCAEAGIEYVELKVAFDGISVLTNPENEAVECLSFADLYALIGPESSGVNNWSGAQALATELGSTTELPDADLTITAPGAESGTYDSFLEIVFGDISEARAEEGKITEDQVETARNDYSSQSDDTAIIAAMEADPTPLGWVGFAFAEEAGDQVKELAISEEPGGECIAPTAETIADGSYPISRSLYIYVNAAKADENPAGASYVDYYLSDEGIASVAEVGYVDLPADDLEATRGVWEARETGTRES